jgi:hypothetical protein
VSTVDDLDRDIVRLEHQLAALKRERADRDHAAFLLAILQITDTWFRTHELIVAAVLSPDVSRWIGGKSAKSVGRLLRRIADDQDRAAMLPALRLLRLERTNGGALWKVESHLPACGAPGVGR